MNTINEKAVLLSLSPKKCEHIATGKTTVEVKKTKPKLETPFKVYIYQTRKGHGENYLLYSMGLSCMAFNLERWRGKIIGEFICDEIIEFYEEKEVHTELDGWPVEAWLMWNMSDKLCEDMHFYGIEDIERCTCMKEADLIYYLSPDMQGYGWHISNLVIYDKPKELSEFYRECEKSKCEDCPNLHFENTPNSYEGWCMFDEKIPIKRPPQSWCYVEEMG